MNAGICRRRKVLVFLALLFTVTCLPASKADADDTEIKAGDTIVFGTYPQEEGSQNYQELNWRVLAVEEGEALLLTEECIEAMPFLQAFPDSPEDDLRTSWRDSTIREWLNSVFVSECFTPEDERKLVERTVQYPDLEKESDMPSGETRDRVFLLSEREVRKYLPSRASRKAGGSNAAVEGEPALFLSELTDTAFWWLRSPGDEDYCAQTVGAEGSVASGGYLVSRPDIGVRPAVWMKVD